ncbi:hypothetical protein GEV33_006793 [Tenebrio molitor]|uniref:Uncharacterized protein n=1 Tax=Tenebrio molitor TaxID=7067 RepID=A0A8J6HKK1_TENMO|nr:hypothetical protein GEV33_006793 [Tenebrio molitor]
MYCYVINYSPETGQPCYRKQIRTVQVQRYNEQVVGFEPVYNGNHEYRRLRLKMVRTARSMGNDTQKFVEEEDSGQEREGMSKSPKARKESSKREREEGRMSEEGLNPFRKSSRTERSPSRGEERNQSKEIEKKIETVLREIKEDMAGIVEESRARRKELAAARDKEGEQEREDMLKSSEVRKESSTREREEEREDHQTEAKKKIKARKWIRK